MLKTPAMLPPAINPVITAAPTAWCSISISRKIARPRMTTPPSKQPRRFFARSNAAFPSVGVFNSLTDEYDYYTQKDDRYRTKRV